eukprot:CAMPEP_0201517844 /NCGR_PEP_ID=MMETSP0161_2-20130828/8850_1 /ASSEMBLY_ACC=CAM_ASM_000251 /TAXON_ID=180227 /ORGANISM="Neoparamoeba aestuarina, Strain SoJaBio B1-5/56/2" /LENGTH=72 /DNA_ID=CAMNT_0047915469 /DNA_START=142 /DNA_END=360 /DNA_ORIENTATION=-
MRDIILKLHIAKDFDVTHEFTKLPLSNRERKTMYDEFCGHFATKVWQERNEWYDDISFLCAQDGKECQVDPA